MLDKQKNMATVSINEHGYGFNKTLFAKEAAKLYLIHLVLDKFSAQMTPLPGNLP